MGGTIDPRTGTVVWDLAVPVEAQLEHYRRRPPSALAAWRCQAAPLPAQALDGHGEPVNVAFSLACRCGGTRFVAFGTVFAENEAPGAPVRLMCAACRTVETVFDASRHGWDGVLCDPAPVPRGGAQVELESTSLGEAYEVLVRLEYPSDVLGDPEWAGREPELFSWFTLLGVGDRGVEVVFDAECA